VRLACWRLGLHPTRSASFAVRSTQRSWNPASGLASSPSTTNRTLSTIHIANRLTVRCRLAVLKLFPSGALAAGSGGSKCSAVDQLQTVFHHSRPPVICQSVTSRNHPQSGRSQTAEHRWGTSARMRSEGSICTLSRLDRGTSLLRFCPCDGELAGQAPEALVRHLYG
jgi:hypothetical protein